MASDPASCGGVARPTLTRRSAVAGLVVAGVTGEAIAQSPLPAPDIMLWPSGPPGHAPRRVDAANKYHVSEPGLFVFRPEAPNGTAVIMFQGGGYERVGRGPGVPTWFAKRGYTVFDMRYRLPRAGWEAGPDVMLQDAQRGMRIIRSRADEFSLDRQRVGVVGFSSGGHMAAFIATCWAREMAPKDSGLLDVPARPDFACLGCPVITMTEPHVHRPSRRNMFGDLTDPAAFALRSPEQQVTPQTPPMFLVHAADDSIVSAHNSIMMFGALKAAGVGAELHVFEKGGHNMGAGFAPGSPLSTFPDLMLAWMARHGF